MGKEIQSCIWDGMGWDSSTLLKAISWTMLCCMGMKRSHTHERLDGPRPGFNSLLFLFLFFFLFFFLLFSTLGISTIPTRHTGGTHIPILNPPRQIEQQAKLKRILRTRTVERKPSMAVKCPIKSIFCFLPLSLRKRHYYLFLLKKPCIDTRVKKVPGLRESLSTGT